VSEKDAASKAAQALSKRGASKGGRARANVLDAEERSEIARKASEKRWAKTKKKDAPEDAPPTELPVKKSAPPAPAQDDLPYSAFPGKLMMGNLELECHVLNDKRRVLTAREVVRALRGTRSNPPGIQRYLDALPDFRPGMFDDRTMRFRIPGLPQVATGMEATVLIDMCDMYITASENGSLRSNQEGLVTQSWIIMRASSKVGIEALIDEATGYQEVREKRALQVKLQAFIADDMQKWVKTFPDEFWEELARLEGIRYQARHRPLRWGAYVLKFVYQAMDEDVAAELKKRNPNPRYKRNLHQLLRDYGKDQLHQQLGGVIAIMRECNDMKEFRARFERVFERKDQLRIVDVDWDAMLPKAEAA
jgi:hypothetical protein